MPMCHRSVMFVCLCLLCLGACEVKPTIEPSSEVSLSDGGDQMDVKVEFHSERSPTKEASKPELRLKPERRPQPEQHSLPERAILPEKKKCKPFSLLEHPLWKKVSREQDPYRALAPKGKCEDVAYKLEDGVIEVETGICSFVTVQQPLKQALKAGDQLKLIYWHLQLTAASSAHGYLSLAIGKERIYVNKIPIPSAPDVYEVIVPIKKNFAKGEKLYFHIHNHGSNTWKLLDLDVMCSKM